jgi:hypothetical protein
MQPGLLAFAAACAFVGAALYINIVEQPARLTLGPHSMVREWTLSNRRSFVLLSTFAVLSAVAAYIHYGLNGDVRWTIGGTVILSSWPYAYFVIVPVNIWLYVLPPDRARSTVRKLMRDWGLLEWGHTAIGLVACSIFAWALLFPV